MTCADSGRTGPEPARCQLRGCADRQVLHFGRGLIRPGRHTAWKGHAMVPDGKVRKAFTIQRETAEALSALSRRLRCHQSEVIEAALSHYHRDTLGPMVATFPAATVKRAVYAEADIGLAQRVAGGSARVAPLDGTAPRPRRQVQRG